MTHARAENRTMVRWPQLEGRGALTVVRNVALVVGALSCCWISNLPGQENTQQGPRSAAPASAATSEQRGTVEGLVMFVGEIPDSPVPDDAGNRRPLLEVDRKTRGLRYVVAHLAPVNDANPNWISSVVTAPPADRPVNMDQLNHEFTPRVIGVRAGQPVKFTNSDPANHNVRTASFQSTNEFNVFTGIDGSYAHRFSSDPQQRPIRVGCDIHPWMRGWIYVFDHAHFSVTDAQGRFRIASVPPGRYKLVLWQPDLRHSAEREVTVAAGETTRIELEVQAPKHNAPKE